MRHSIPEHLSASVIEAKIVQLAERISTDYKGQKLILVGLMKGCIFFLADLARKIKEIELDLEIIYVASYRDTKSTGNVEVLLDMRKDINSKHVLIVDDIVDTGLTLNKIKALFGSRSPSSIEFCVLFDKIETRLEQVAIKYTGFEVPNYFFVGYGMDYNGRFRELPYLGILPENLKQDNYAK